jgi:hypothetical protein
MKRLIATCLFRARITVLVAVLALFMQVAEATAGNTAIFDNGAPDQHKGNEVTQWVQSEDFMVEQPEILTDCHFWTFEGAGAPAGGNPWDGTLEYWVFADNAGAPGAIIDSGLGQNKVRTGTGVIVLETYNEFAYDFDMERPVPLVAGNIYWLGLHLASDYTDRDEIYWETTNQGLGAFGSTGIESYGGTFDNWANNDRHHAFYLTTPELTTMALLGFGALSLLRKRKK